MPGGRTSDGCREFGFELEFQFKKNGTRLGQQIYFGIRFNQNKRRRQTCKNRRSLGTKFSLGKESQRTMVLFDVFQFQDPNGHWFRQK